MIICERRERRGKERKKERKREGKKERVGMGVVCGLVSIIDLGQVLSNATGEE